MKRLKPCREGFTVIEMLVYAALFAVLSLLLVRSMLGIHSAYRKLQHERDVASAARSVATTLAREVRAAERIYTPTSLFDVPNGQISLKTSLEPSFGEADTYIDFYLDNGRLYLKREGAAAIPLTSEAVRVGEFRASRLALGEREALRIAVQISARSPGQHPASSTIKATFTPRGNYQQE